MSDAIQHSDSPTRRTFAPGLAALGLVLLAACGGSNSPGPLVPQSSTDVCGAPPANVEQDLSQDVRAQIAGYVNAGAGGSNKQRLTQVLGQQGLMCDALAYRSCMAAHSAHASPDQMREMMQVALSACASSGAPIAAPREASGVSPVVPAKLDTPSPQPSRPAPAPADSTDWQPGKYMKQAVDLVATTAFQVEQKSQFGFDGGGACVLGAYMDEKKEITMGRPFEAGTEYLILGGGSDGTVDLDLGIGKPGGGFLATDTDDDATPVVKFTPPSAGNYVVHLSLAKATGGGAFAAVAILKKGGYSVPTSNLTSSFTTAISGAARASALVHQKTGAAGLIFHGAEDWSFYATILKQGEETTYNGLDLPGPMSVVLASGDDALQDADIVVTDSANSKKVAEDTDADPRPIVLVQADKGHTYSVNVKNARSKGAALVTTLVLDSQQ